LLFQGRLLFLERFPGIFRQRRRPEKYDRACDEPGISVTRFHTSSSVINN
jgi:hypothetical protein